MKKEVMYLVCWEGNPTHDSRMGFNYQVESLHKLKVCACAEMLDLFQREREWIKANWKVEDKDLEITSGELFHKVKIKGSRAPWYKVYVKGIMPKY